MPDLHLPVCSVRKETPSTRVVRVGLGGRPFTYRAGQAVRIGPADAGTRVPYSIASAPGETARDGRLEFLIKVHDDGRWGDGFEVPRRGTPLAVRGPEGQFVLPEPVEEKRLLFIAGGTGIAPLRAMIRQSLLTLKPRPLMRLLYSARTSADFAYAGELREMARRGEIELTLTATRESSSRWRGSRGRIAADQLRTLVDDPATLCFVCGPAAMVDDVPATLRRLGVALSRIRLEQW